jgi:hypothetical protein
MEIRYIFGMLEKRITIKVHCSLHDHKSESLARTMSSRKMIKYSKEKASIRGMIETFQ